MKKIFLLLAAAAQFTMVSCQKTKDDASVKTPRTTVPDELVGRWAIMSISGSTVYNIPAGTTYNTNEVFLGYTIKKDGTLQEHGYASTYMYGVSTWSKWVASGSAQLQDKAITFHRDHGTYTSSRSSAEKAFGPNEVYPNKSFSYVDWEIGKDSRGQTALFLLDNAGVIHTYVKQ